MWSWICCGESTKGEYLHTLNVVDIATYRCEPVALRNRSQEAVKGEHIEFTRCRPYRKNDQAHIGEKLGGGEAANRVRPLRRGEAFRVFEAIYTDWRLLVNFFTPVRKLIRKERVGAKVRKVYDWAQTPYHRVLALGEIGEEERARLREAYLELNPVEIRRRMEENVRKLWGLNG